MLRIAIIIYSILFFERYSFSQDEYFLTLRYNKVNLRQGPSREYPVKIFYKKKFLPVLIQDKSDNFRKIRDHENNTGWIHISQLSKKKAAIVIDDRLIMFKNPTIFTFNYFISNFLRSISRQAMKNNSVIICFTY